MDSLASRVTLLIESKCGTQATEVTFGDDGAVSFESFDKGTGNPNTEDAAFCIQTLDFIRDVAARLAEAAENDALNRGDDFDE